MVAGSIPVGPAKPSFEKIVTCGRMNSMFHKMQSRCVMRPSPFPMRPDSNRLNPDKTVAVLFNTCRYSEYGVTDAHFNAGNFVFRFA